MRSVLSRGMHAFLAESSSFLRIFWRWVLLVATLVLVLLECRKPLWHFPHFGTPDFQEVFHLGVESGPPSCTGRIVHLLVVQWYKGLKVTTQGSGLLTSFSVLCFWMLESVLARWISAMCPNP